MALMLCPSLAMAEDVAPPVIPATEVEAATPEPVTPSPTEDSSMYGFPSMDENLILTSVVGVPDELRVIFSLDGQEVAVVQGNQILHTEAFPQDQKIFLQMRIEGQGRLMGARFGFEPFTTPVILPELLELPVETPELENPEENTDSAEADNTEPGTSAEDTTELVETVEPENPTEITPEDPVINNDIDTAEPGTEPAEEDLDNTEPTEDNTADETGTSEPDPATSEVSDTEATSESAGETSADAGENTDSDSSGSDSANSGNTGTEE